MKDLSNRQKELLITIFHSMKIYGKAPSYSEMVQNMDVSSKQAIADLLLQLNDKGYITISENKYRGIYLSAAGVRALVECGDIKESVPQVVNGKIFYEYQITADNSALLEKDHSLQTMNGQVTLSQAESNNSNHIGASFNPMQRDPSVTRLSSDPSEVTENQIQGNSVQNFQNNLFVVNQNLKKVLSDNTIDFRPEIKTPGIIDLFKKILGI